MVEEITVSSIQLPDAFKPYQDAIDLIWNDNMQETSVNSIVSKLSEFVENNVVSKQFISNLLRAALDIGTKNYHIIHQVSQQIQMHDYYQIKPNLIFWNDDVDTYVK